MIRRDFRVSCRMWAHRQATEATELQDPTETLNAENNRIEVTLA